MLVVKLLLWVFLNIKLILSLADINVNRNSKHLIDSEGRVRIFHGVNIVVKNPPWTPKEDSFDPLFSLSAEDYDYLVKFGFNVVRLGLIWEAVETAPGIYNQTYLDIYENIINKLGERGIYTILDSHQDMFSRILCGEGVPVFYARELTYKSECNGSYLEKLLNKLGLCFSFQEKKVPLDKEGLPLIEVCKKISFVELHSAVELGSIYSSFFANSNNIQDKFINYWKVLASKFKGNKYIIGYDIWNELWVGDLFLEIQNMVPGHYTNEKFLPFYAKVDKELRKVDDDFVLMFEEAIFPDTVPLMGGFYLGGFKETPAGSKYLHKQIWSKHYYCKGISLEASRWKTIPTEVSKTDCYSFAEYKMRTAKQKADELGVNLFITEFGACEEGQDKGESCYHEIKGLADASDRYHLSWAYWMYKPYGDHTTHCDDDTEGIWYKDGSVQHAKLRALTRPYIMAFQGSPIKSFFYSELNLLHSKFVVNTDIDNYSIVYVNKDIYFSNGFKFLLVSHEMNQHLIQNSNVNVVKSQEINNKDLPIDNYTWNEKDFEMNYLKFKILSNNKENNLNSKDVYHQYLGFSSILENTVEFLLCPKFNYTIAYKNEELMKKNNIKNIKLSYEDLNEPISVLNRENADNVILVENKQIKEAITNSYVLLDFKNSDLEDLDNFNSSVELVKPIQFNKEVVLDLVYINKLSVKIILNEAVVFEAVFENILNHFIKIVIE